MPTTNILDLNNRVGALESGGGGGAADGVTYDPTTSHLEANNVQDAIDELSGEIAGLSADNISYDGTDSGLSSVTVQGAIDETVNKIETLGANDVSYDNSDSGLTATDVQGAVDEVAGAIDDLAASDIAYGLSTVDAALDGLMADTIGTAVDVYSYTSSNKYTCPSDGYLYLKVTGTNSWIVYAIGQEDIEWGVSEAGGGYNSMYVKKGMQIWKLRQSSVGTHEAKFYPLQ